MPSMVFNLVIEAEEYQRLYAGLAKSVSAVSVDGRRVHFPAHILRQFVSYDGVRGRFMIHFDSDNRFQSIERLA